MSALFPEVTTQERGNNYGKYPLFSYESTSDTDALYYHQDMNTYYRKDLLLDMIKDITDQFNNSNF